MDEIIEYICLDCGLTMIKNEKLNRFECPNKECDYVILFEEEDNGFINLNED